jgi:hypothetical protein
MLIDPYILLAKCFSTWLRLRILMGFTMIWCVILIGLSGWMTEATGGSFASYDFPSNRTYHSWSSLCDSAPYSYLSPFQFSYSADGGSSNVDTICPWPSENSDLRFTITVVGIVNLGILFVKTPISLFARSLLVMYALLFFSSFVMDAYASTSGNTYCQSSFVNTNMYTDIKSANMNLTCNSSNFSGVAVIDLIISCLFFILHTAWGLTTDLYVDRGKGNKGDEKSLLKNKV